jgi:S1-C subfamily serine protease
VSDIKKGSFVAVIFLVSLSGCAMSTAVISINDYTGEKFVGTATSGSGKIEVANGGGVTCTGKYNSHLVWTATEGIAREGVLNCSDGRSGSFNVAGTALGGQGVGTLDDEPITLYYGQQVGLYKASPQSRRRSPKKEKTGGTGSGFVVNSNGHIVTNQHVIDGCTSLIVSTRTRKEEGVIVAEDDRNDIAVILVAHPIAHPLNVRTEPKIKLAEDVIALGFPLQSILAKQLHVTSGDVTALAGMRSDTRFIQVSAPIQPGNSGGPIVDQYGNVVAMATAKLNAVVVAGATGDVPQNINFGLKSAVITNFLDAYHIPYSRNVKNEIRDKTKIVASIEDSVVFVECHVN